MHLLFLFLRVYPAFAIMMVVVLGELGWYFHRKKNPYRFICWGLAALFLISTGVWFALGGYDNSDQWLKGLEH